MPKKPEGTKLTPTGQRRADFVEKLPIRIPPYWTKSSPISMTDPHWHLLEALKPEGPGETPRTEFFEKTLVGIYWTTGKDVPYAFDTEGTIRSLDYGCMKFLKCRGDDWVDLIVDEAGYIVAVRPLARFLEKYAGREAELIVRLAEGDGSGLPSAQDDFDACREEVEAEPNPTTRRALYDARIGQGRFRTSLLERWGKCAVTGVRNRSMLRASHIKPWRVSNNEERLHEFNGLLLTANLDAAFDAGLIGFEDDGRIRFNKKLSSEDRQALGLHKGMKIDGLKKAHRPYLEYHREEVMTKAKVVRIEKVGG